MSTEALLSKTVSVKIYTKVHLYDLAFRGVHAHPAVTVRNSWSDEGDSSHWIVLFCERYCARVLGGGAKKRRANEEGKK